MRSPSHPAAATGRTLLWLAIAANIIGIGNIAGCHQGKPDGPVWFDALRFIRRCDPPQGHFTLELYTLRDGTVPAAFFHDAIPRVSAKKLRCMSMIATEARLPQQADDELRSLTIYCDYRTIAPSESQVICSGGWQWARAEQPFDAPIARDTFYVAPWASATDQAWGELYAGMRAASLEDFRSALERDPDDPSAREGAAAAKAAMAPGAAAEIDAADAPIQFFLEDETDGGAPLDTAEDGLVPETRIALTPLSPKTRQLNASIRAPTEVSRPIREKNSQMAESGDGGVEPINRPTPTALVFLPGIGGGVRDYRAELDKFGPGRLSIALELPGLGFSDGPRRDHYNRRAILEDLLAALDQLKLDRCVLIATGASATIAAAFASTYPSRVRGMLLLDPFGDLTQADPIDLANTQSDLSSDDYLTTFDTYVHALFDHSRASTRALVLREAHMLRKEAAEGYYAIVAQEPVAHDLRSLQAPIRILRSVYDDEPFALATLLPELPARTVPDSSSFLMLDEPALVETELETLLQEVEGRP